MITLFTRNSLPSLISAPLIWALHFTLSYVIVSLACAYDFGGAHVSIALVTLLALALLIFIGAANWRKWRRERQTGRSSGGGTDPDVAGANMGAFFSLASLMLCVLSAVALIWVALPAAVLPTCAA